MNTMQIHLQLLLKININKKTPPPRMEDPYIEGVAPEREVSHWYGTQFQV
jgi:hypothetical protein